MAHRSYADASRNGNWGDDDSRALTLDQLQLGAMLRIAAALEKMADPYVRLLDRVASLSRRLDEELARGAKLRRQIVALRGVVTRTKKRSAGRK